MSMTSLALIRVCMLTLVVGRLVWSTGRAAQVIPGEVVQVESSTREPLKVLIEPTESGVATILLLVGRWVSGEADLAVVVMGHQQKKGVPPEVIEFCRRVQVITEHASIFFKTSFSPAMARAIVASQRG